MVAIHNRFAAIAGFVVLVTPGLARAADPPSAPWRPDGPLRPWSVSGKIAKSKDVSAACLTAPGKGVVLSDETRFFQLIDIDAAKLTVRAGERVDLLIAGASGIDPGKGAEFILFYWRGPGSQPAVITRLHDLSCKAEGMMVVQVEPALLEVLFWFDGAEAGGPRSLRLRAAPKP